jgi:hypothetical protein
MTPVEEPKESRPRRGFDFVMGFSGALLAGILVCGVAVLGRGSSLSILPCILLLGGLLAALGISFRKRRRFIAFGILAFLGLLLAIPLVALGACFVAVGRM